MKFFKSEKNHFFKKNSSEFNSNAFSSMILIRISSAFQMAFFDTVLTPGLLQKMSKKSNSPGIFSGLVMFWAYFSKIWKKSQKFNSPGVSTIFQIVVLKKWSFSDLKNFTGFMMIYKLRKTV